MSVLYFEKMMVIYKSTWCHHHFCFVAFLVFHPDYNIKCRVISALFKDAHYKEIVSSTHGIIEQMVCVAGVIINQPPGLIFTLLRQLFFCPK